MTSAARPTSETCAVGVMAKAPQAGRSKTRLCPPLTPDEAAALSAAFLRDTTANVAEAARRTRITPYAAYAPLGGEALVRAHVAPETRLVLAHGTPAATPGVEGFGRCLLQAVVGMLGAGHAAACVLSSDVPNLPTEYLVAAVEHLLRPGERGVLGACEDGGYYILGLKAPHARLFADVAWSTDAVAASTRARAREIGLDLVEVPTWYDVDDASSLDRLRGASEGFLAPATRAALAALGLRGDAGPLHAGACR